MTTPSDSRFTVAFTSVGRRCELVDAFRASIRNLGLEPRLIGVDAERTAPALHFCDEAVQAPRCDAPGYGDFLEQLVVDESIDLVVPLIDTELELIAELRPRLERHGATVLISDAATVKICSDKFETYNFFASNHVPTPMTVLPAAMNEIELPVVVKPRRGSSSVHVYRCDTERERAAALELVSDALIQERASGQELTLDVLTDLSGTLIQTVVRERRATRGGESAIGVVVDRPEVEAQAARLVGLLDARGPITIQCFEDAGRLWFTEINCRLGGGFPLAYEAGADFPGLIVRMCRGEEIAPVTMPVKYGLATSRYDRAVFFEWTEGTSGASSRAVEDDFR